MKLKKCRLTLITIFKFLTFLMLGLGLRIAEELRRSSQAEGCDVGSPLRTQDEVGSESHLPRRSICH